jgi:membrane protein insertase Oxa1/YidC/SpoIIIJ
MAGSQVVSMLLPQWIQKSKLKKLEKLGKNPAQKQQDNKMKWFTYIMMVMIIVMGFSLASAMGVYWLIGALISIAQTLITNAVNNRKTHKKKK